MNQTRVLVVDDDDIVRRGICSILSAYSEFDIICETSTGLRNGSTELTSCRQFLTFRILIRSSTLRKEHRSLLICGGGLFLQAKQRKLLTSIPICPKSPLPNLTRFRIQDPAADKRAQRSCCRLPGSPEDAFLLS